MMLRMMRRLMLFVNLPGPLLFMTDVRFWWWVEDLQVCHFTSLALLFKIHCAFKINVKVIVVKEVIQP